MIRKALALRERLLVAAALMFPSRAPQDPEARIVRLPWRPCDRLRRRLQRTLGTLRKRTASVEGDHRSDFRPKTGRSTRNMSPSSSGGGRHRATSPSPNPTTTGPRRLPRRRGTPPRHDPHDRLPGRIPLDVRSCASTAGLGALGEHSVRSTRT